ncbi:MAG: alpha-E domain-containing protein [Chitinophagaceae bacterium]
MLARTADSLYWMTRYMERVDLILRVLSNGFYVSYDINDRQHFDWSAIVRIFCYLPEEQFSEVSSSADNVLRQLLTMDGNNSLRVLVTKARENARGTQDLLTREVWEAINEIYHSVNCLDIEKAIATGEQMALLIKQMDESRIYYGVFENTMSRGEGWNFMNLGRFIERAIQTLNFAETKFNVFLKEKTEDTNNILYWKNLLLNLSGYELYLKAYRGGNHEENIIDMVFLNEFFPKSLAYTANKIQIYITNILRENNNVNNKKIKRKTGMLFAKIRYTDIESIQQKGVIVFIEELKADLYELSQLIGQSFFSYY